MPYPEGRLLRLPGDLLLKLELHLSEFHPRVHLEDHIAGRMASWLAADAAKCAAREASQCTRGYQWKDVFLVDRTLLRTVVRGENFTAEVRHDGLIYDELPISPSQFANGFGVRGRNAWECIWVLSPGSLQWVRAGHLRSYVAGRGRSNSI